MDGKPQGQSARTLAQLEAEITELAGHLNAAQHRWLGLIAEFDRRNGWAEAGCLSCAHWLNFKCGIALGAAREKVRVAHALEALPKISAATSRFAGRACGAELSARWNQPSVSVLLAAGKRSSVRAATRGDVSAGTRRSSPPPRALPVAHAPMN